MPNTDNLVLDESFKPVFRSIARTIAVHNIWFCFEDIDTTEKCELYINNGVKGLIIRKDTTNPINFVDHPLLYTLCLTDTIDPVKIILQYARRKNVSVNLIEILKQVELVFEVKENLILSTENQMFKEALLERFPIENMPPIGKQKTNKYWLGIDISVR